MKKKTSITKSNHKTVIFSTLRNFQKENLLILIAKTKISTVSIKKINVTIIDVNAY